jgi:hypothetical protein
MIEIQVRKPCSKPASKNYGGEASVCPECGEITYRPDRVVEHHHLVIVWMPLAEAERLAHEEEVRAVGAAVVGNAAFWQDAK